MISTAPNSKSELQQRTRGRNDTIWVGLLTGTALAEDESLFNDLYRTEVESYLTMTDEVFTVKEYERDQGVAQSQAEVDQSNLLATEKAATERTRIALKIGADNVLYAARVYDAQVRGLLMAAREYAGQAEVAQQQAEAAKHLLGVEKEAVRAQEIGVKIEIEGIQRAMVQADLAKEKLEVAKAGVRALVANVGAEEAAVKVVEAQVQIAMTQAESLELQADVVMLYAEAITKQISAITLAVETAGIEQGFGIIAQHLGDMLPLWGQRAATEGTKTADQSIIAGAIATLAAAEVVGAQVVVDEATSAVAVALEEKSVASGATGAEAPLLLSEADGRVAVSAAESANRVSMAAARAAMAILVNAAKTAVSKSRNVTRDNQTVDLYQVFKG
jgi:hypothetical protein